MNSNNLNNLKSEVAGLRGEFEQSLSRACNGLNKFAIDFARIAIVSVRLQRYFFICERLILQPGARCRLWSSFLKLILPVTGLSVLIEASSGSERFSSFVGHVTVEFL